MAYTHYVDTTPLLSQDGDDAVDSMRNNMLALRDAVIAGAMVKWDATVTIGTGSNEKPQYLYLHKNGASTERIRCEYTYGTTGGETDNVKTITLSYTADDDPLGSAVWDSIGVCTLTYNSDGTVASWAWS
jgi:hypothetical protein